MRTGPQPRGASTDPEPVLFIQPAARARRLELTSPLARSQCIKEDCAIILSFPLQTAKEPKCGGERTIAEKGRKVED